MSAAPDRRHRLVAVLLAGLALSGVGLAYAAVPLYEMFCRVTGFGGATRVAAVAPDGTLDRTMRVRFDANVAPGLPWTFVPEEREVEVRVGETRLVYFRVTNRADRPTAGIASYNVAPGVTGPYFAKLQCFCFSNQVLKPGETLEMPVAFFVDPAIAEDRTLDRLRTITLSYTFFAAKEQPAPVADASGGRPKL